MSAESTESSLERLRFVDLTRRSQTQPLPVPLQNPALLPLVHLEPSVLERLVAEIVQRDDNRGVQFYGRSGQKQHGLDIVRKDISRTTTLVQVRRLQALAPIEIRTALTDYAGAPRAANFVGEERLFSPKRFVLATSAELDNDTANVKELHKLQNEYDGDLDIEVWGAEAISRVLRDAPRLVGAIFGLAWAKAWCGFEPPPSDAMPEPAGFVEDPVVVLNLESMVADAQACDESEPLTAARLWSVIAEGLADGSFPGHAVAMRQRQAKALAAAGHAHDAFEVLCGLQLNEIESGKTTARGAVAHELRTLDGALTESERAKDRLLQVVADWYEHGSELDISVPALRDLADAGDRDTARLCCFVTEQAIVDGLFDFDPPWSLVADVSDRTPGLLAQLSKMCASATSADPMLRARLACARADTSLSSNASEADVESAYGQLAAAALAGRYLHFTGFVASRAAYAFAIRGARDRAENLWRQSILANSAEGNYGDVRCSLRSLHVLDSESSIVRFGTENLLAALPNRQRLLAGAHDPALGALESAHNDRLPDAFGDARRYWWESRLAGHLLDELMAANLFGDVLSAAEHPEGAIESWIIGGQGKKAAEAAARLATPVNVDRWLDSRLRERQAAAVQQVGAQVAGIEDDDVQRVVDALLVVARNLWDSPWMTPSPESEAVKSIASFGVRIPAACVDRLIELAEPALANSTRASDVIANLLVQAFWAVPSRRAGLALAVARLLDQPAPPHDLWGLIEGIPETGRHELLPTIERLADAGSVHAIGVLASWDVSSPAVQLRARQACTALLRRHIGDAAAPKILGTQEIDTVELLIALIDATDLTDVTIEELLPGVARPAGGVVMTRTRIVESSARSSELPPTEGRERGPIQADAAARLGMASPLQLAEAVAEQLMLIGEDPHSGAASRSQAIYALRRLLPRLPAAINATMSSRLLELHEEPHLTEDDEWELGSLVPLSRGRFDTGAKHLTSVALAASTEAFRHSRDAARPMLPEESEYAQVAFAHAAKLLRDFDSTTRRYGARAVAEIARSAHDLASLSLGLILDPEDHVRAVGAQLAELTEPLIEGLLADPSARVRAALLERDVPLTPDQVARLGEDPHLVVRRGAEAVQRALTPDERAS